jgi:hypothetical protein
MSSFDVALHPLAFRHVRMDDIQEDFVFIVGKQRYNCPRIIVHLLSRRLLLQKSIDTSINEYVVETKDPKNEFPLFLSLGRGSLVTVTTDSAPFVFSLCRELDNSDIFGSLLEHFGAHRFYPLFDDDALPFIASEFHSLTDTELSQIPLSTLYHILSHPLLTLRSEDSLYSYIHSHLSSDPAYCQLFEFVHFKYLSSEYISEFIDLNAQCIDHRLWSAISPRLTSSFMFVLKKTQLYGEFGCQYQVVRSGHGVISYLTWKHDGNVHDKGAVTITSKSCVYGALRNIVNCTPELYLSLKNEPGQWVCWDFHAMRVIPTHYTIQTLALRSWVIEGSLDGVDWREIDRRIHSDSPQSWMASFPVSDSPQCRFVRLTRTGMNRSGNSNLLLYHFEIFGDLIELHE